MSSKLRRLGLSETAAIFGGKNLHEKKRTVTEHLKTRSNPNTRNVARLFSWALI